jgi:glycosyltransferase involved in cell wall biosynthesis
VIAVSRTVEACTRAWLGASKHPIQVIPDGVNFERFEHPPEHDFHAELGVEKTRPIVGLVARYLEVKRIEDFIDAAASVGGGFGAVGDDSVDDRGDGATGGEGTGIGKAADADSRPVFVIMGGGPDSLGGPLKARAAAVAEKADIRFLGGRNDLPAILPSLAVGVLCSEVEGCPNTILEYMAAGVPIAATRIPSIEELVAHEEHALLSPVHDPSALAESIQRLLADRALARRLVEASHLHVRNYGWDIAESAYEAVYDRVLGREPTPAARQPPASTA